MDESNKDQEQHELEKLRRKKMKALLEAQKRQQANQERVISINDKIIYVLQVVLAPDAFSYFEKIRANEPMVYQAIFNELGVPRKIPLDAIIYLERKIKGIKGKIQVKMGDGEMMDLGSFLKK